MPSKAAATSIESGSLWANDQNGLTLNYNFWTTLPIYYTGGDAEASGFEAFSSQLEDATVKILDMIETFTNITFVETNDELATELGFAQTVLNSGAAAWAYYPSGNPKGGDVWTDKNITSDTQTQEGGQTFYTLLHEIGHALGLEHSFEAGLTGAENTEQYTVMAYDVNSTWGNEYAQSYMLYDIYALQQLYGVNTNYNSGDTVYTLRSGDAYTIWDSGGTDTLDGSAISSDMTINLRDGEYSSVGLTENIAIAYDAIIENATGGSGNDTIYDNDFSNVILGGNGNDSLFAGLGNDTLNGGAGTDQVTYNYSVDAFSFSFIDSITVALTHLTELFTDTIISIESFFFSGSQFTFTELQNTYGGNIIQADINDIVTNGTAENDVITGNIIDETLRGLVGNDTLYGMAGLDYLYGNEGSDTIYGGYGEDRIYGGDGNDTLYGERDNDRIYGHLGDDTIYGDHGWDILYGLEGNDIIYGGIGNDIIRGDDDAALDGFVGAGNDELHGEDGSDIISGGAGDDVLYGDAGNDRLYGNAGNDTLYGGDHVDRLYGISGNNTMYGDGGNDYLYGGTGIDVLYGGDGRDRMYGNEGADEMHGGNDNDYLYGNDGNDTIYGDAGIDRIYGHLGDDTLYGGIGDDLLYGLDGNDTLHGGTGVDRLYGGNDNDTLNGNEDNDILYGESGNDTINGDAGNDYLYGGVGNDTLAGGAGSDQLYGQSGADTFLLDTTSIDRIVDFDISEGDVLDLSNLLSGYNSGVDDINDFLTLVYKHAGRSDIYINEDGVGNDAQHIGIIYSDLTGETIDTMLISNSLIV